MFKLKQHKIKELSSLLQNKFIDKNSTVVGRDFEDLVIEYFEGGYRQTNIEGKVQSAFSDVTDDDDTYFSVKWSEAVWDSPLSKVCGDNFRYTTPAKLISQCVLMSEGKYTNELKHMSYEDLIKFMQDKEITNNKFGILTGYASFTEQGPNEIPKELVFKIKYSNILTGLELYSKLLDVVRDYGIDKELRSHTITKVFGEQGNQEFFFKTESPEIYKLRKVLKDTIMDNTFNTEKDMLQALQSIVGGYE